jgi:hypothetical protein
MRNLHQATLYPGHSARSNPTNISVGRGTDTPFEHVGAPMDRRRQARGCAERAPDSRRQVLSRALHANRQQIFRAKNAPASSSSLPTGRFCGPCALGLEIASALWKLFPGKFEIDQAARLFGSTAGLVRIKNGDDPAACRRSRGRLPKRAGA